MQNISFGVEKLAMLFLAFLPNSYQFNLEVRTQKTFSPLLLQLIKSIGFQDFTLCFAFQAHILKFKCQDWA